MNIALTQAELGEAMRRLAAMEGSAPKVTRWHIGAMNDPKVAARRARARELRNQGLPLAAVLERLHAAGITISMATLKSDLAKTP